MEKVDTSCTQNVIHIVAMPIIFNGPSATRNPGGSMFSSLRNKISEAWEQDVGEL